MPLDASFRLSTYLTLALACAALGYAESALLPEVGAFAALVVLALAVIYRLETRVPLLSLAAANKLGAGIGLVGLVWAAFRVLREAHTGEFVELGWPLFLVTLIAPVLMAAIAAKMLREEKHAGDYWQLHAAGLGAVVLAGAMAEDLASFALTAAYAACGVWSLADFFLARAGGSVPPIPVRARFAADHPPPRVRSAAGGGSARGAGFRRALAWTGGAVVVAVPLYLLTPRSSFGKLDFGGRRIEIGFAADQMLDLNRTGTLTENKEVAFAVTAAEADGRPKEDLSADQRWRGTVLTRYDAGNWRRDSRAALPDVEPTARLSRDWTPPSLGPGAYRLTFTVPVKLRAQFLSDPVAWVPDEPVPVADLPDGGPPEPWLPNHDGSFGRNPGPRLPRGHVRYVQYTRPPAEADIGPGFEDVREINRELTANPVSAVKAYADTVLSELVRDGRLPAAVLTRDAVRLQVPEEHHEAVARAFRDHLEHRADLAYTTEIKRVKKGIDPVEDFLFHAHAGHCERFATALLLMVRSQGIPAVLVLGFKGCDHVGGGKYEVRQEYAHVWVETLVSRPPTAGDARGPRTWHWLTLDPSPARTAGPAAADDAGGLWARIKSLFDRYLVRYSPDQRERTLGETAAALSNPVLLVGTGVVLAVGLIAWGLRRRLGRRAVSPVSGTAGWFDRLVVVLAAHGYTPGPGDTPREFAATVATALHARPGTAVVAEVPPAWAEAYYQTRFGGESLSAERRSELDAGLDALRDALAAEQRGGK